MIVWICSYPRSGNTLTRIILKRCFGASSFTVYDPSRPGRLPDISGTAPFEGNTEELLKLARTSTTPAFVKTHDLDVPPNEKMLYIIRDGRAAMASFRSYQKTYNAVDLEWEELVLGAHQGPSWADHVLWGTQRSPENTIVLRYEELCNASAAILQRLSDFIELPITGEMDVSFAKLRDELPEFFTTGTNEPGIAEIERVCPALFWMVNGDAMRANGYIQGARPWSREQNIEAANEMRTFAMRQRNKIKRQTRDAPGIRPADRTNMRP